MDQNTLVSNLRSMSDKIIMDHQSVSLIMLLGNNIAEHTTAFDYIISAKWLNDFSPDEGMEKVLDYLYDHLSKEDLKRISRVTIIHTDDFIVQNFVRHSRQVGGMSFNIDCQFGQLIVPYVIIMESRIEY